MASPNPPPFYSGEAPFVYPSAKKPLKTWYKVVGDLESGIRPLVIIHGGPGLTHDLLLSHTDLSTQYSIPVIFYDQIGSGRSTHLPETGSIPDFWTEKIFVSQLKQLLVHLKIDDNWAMLGSSWGGMLGSYFAALRHKGLKKVILANSTASKALSTANLNRYKEQMPKEMRDILAKHEKEGTTSDPEYIATSAAFNAAFTKKHVCNIDPLPEDLLASLKWSKEDRTVVNAMGENNGPENPGFIARWDTSEEVKNINVPTLVITGVEEQASGDAVKPFLDNIPDVRLVTFKNSTHCTHLEQREEYMKAVAEFCWSNTAG